LKIKHFSSICLLAGLAALVSGCASKPNIYAKGGSAEMLPKLTDVMTGAVGVLLTHKKDYSADFVIKFEDANGKPSPVAGQLLVRGGKLRLEAVFDKSMTAGDVGVIWDAGADQGFVFSEDLQAFAPVYKAVRFTNLVTQVVSSSIERIQSHPVEKANLTFKCNDGRAISFQTFSAQDLGGLPMQVSSLNTFPSFTMTLSNIRLEMPAEELFLPPDGFTRYANEEAMLNELGIRQQSGFKGQSDPGGVNINYKPAGSGKNY
jgi:hypothetical protein